MKDLEKFGYSEAEIEAMSPAQQRGTLAALNTIQHEVEVRSIMQPDEFGGADWALRRDEGGVDVEEVKQGLVLPKAGLKIPVQDRAEGYAPGRLEESAKELFEWASGERQDAIEALKVEIKDGHLVGRDGVYNKDLLDFIEKRDRGIDCRSLAEKALTPKEITVKPKERNKSRVRDIERSL